MAVVAAATRATLDRLAVAVPLVDKQQILVHVAITAKATAKAATATTCRSSTKPKSQQGKHLKCEVGNRNRNA